MPRQNNPNLQPIAKKRQPSGSELVAKRKQLERQAKKDAETASKFFKKATGEKTRTGKNVNLTKMQRNELTYIFKRNFNFEVTFVFISDQSKNLGTGLPAILLQRSCGKSMLPQPPLSDHAIVSESSRGFTTFRSDNPDKTPAPDEVQANINTFSSENNIKHLTPQQLWAPEKPQQLEKLEIEGIIIFTTK